MKARCWKCGAAFKFDENRISGKALIKCPVCSARTLIQENKDAELPKFVIKPYKNLPKPAVSGSPAVSPQPKPEQVIKEQPEKTPVPEFQNLSSPSPSDSKIDDLINEKQEVAVKKKSEEKYDDLISHETPAFGDGAKELGINPEEVFTRAPAMRGVEMSDLGAPVVRGSRIVAPVAKEDKQEKNDKSDKSDNKKPSRSDMEMSSLSDSKIKTIAHPHLPKPPKEPSKFVNYVIIFLLLVVAVGATYILKPEIFVPKQEEPTQEEKIHPGKLKLNELQKSMGQQDGNVMQLIKQGETAFQKDLPDEYVRALDVFKKALVLDPDNAELIVRYVESYAKVNTWNVNMGTIRDFMDMLEYADTLAPGLSSIHRAKARIYTMIEQNDKALKEAEIAKRLEENNLENWVVLAEIQLKLNPSQTVEILTEVVAASQPPLSAVLPLAQAYEKLGKFNMAEKVFKMRDDMDGGQCSLCRYLGNMYESLEEYEKAGETYSMLIEKNPSDANGYIGLANIGYKSNENLDKVLGSLSSLPPETIDSFNAEGKVQLFCHLSHYFLLENKLDDAAINAEKAYKMNNESPCGRYHYVLTSLLRGNISVDNRQKIKEIIETLDFDLADVPEIHILWGLFYNQAGNLRNAMSSYQKVVHKYPEFYTGTLMMALMHLETINPIQSYSIIEKLFNYPPYVLSESKQDDLYTDVFEFESKLVSLLEKVDEASVDRDRKETVNGLVYFVLGMNDKSEDAFKSILANNPNNMNANLFLSDLAYQKNDLVNARKYLKAVLNKNHKDPVLNYQMARILAKEGKIKQAINKITKSIPINRKFAFAQIMLAELYMQNEDLANARSVAKLAYKLDTTSEKAKSILYKVNKE